MDGAALPGICPCTGLEGAATLCKHSILTRPVRLCAQPFSGLVEVVGTAHSTTGVRRLVKAVVRGLRASQEPEVAADGLGGTYFFMNEAGRKVAIMKPCDEEPLAPNNPKVRTLHADCLHSERRVGQRVAHLPPVAYIIKVACVRTGIWQCQEVS